jgi:hypothetical protein
MHRMVASRRPALASTASVADTPAATVNNQNRRSTMNLLLPRRRFLKAGLTTGTALGLAELDFLATLPPVSAAEARLRPNLVRLSPEIEPLVRLLEETPRQRLLKEVGRRVQRGLAYREVLAALLLAGVRNVQPRPVGFKFHAVLVVNSAHLASLASPDSDRWLPIFWALDYFKDSQARNEREGNWRLGPVDEAAVPPAHKARDAFLEAMNNWDEAAADAAVASLARTATPKEVFEIFCRFGARDFRDIGHKAIYVANSWRTLQHIGWQHAEPVLRSLAYALLEHEDGNPAQRDAEPDRPWRHNLEVARDIRRDWPGGKVDSSATTELLAFLRDVTAAEASRKVVELLNRGIAPRAVWDALFQGAGELLMREPGIRSLHAVTCANALHFAFETTERDETKRLLLLQAASFLPLFRGQPGKPDAVRIDDFAAEPVKASGPQAVDEIFAELSRDRLAAARKTLSYLKANPEARAFHDTARRLLFLKGTNAHDYKFSSAVLEDFAHVSPAWRDRYLAASAFWLSGSGKPDNELVRRIRAALAA